MGCVCHNSNYIIAQVKEHVKFGVQRRVATGQKAEALRGMLPSKSFLRRSARTWASPLELAKASLG